MTFSIDFLFNLNKLEDIIIPLVIKQSSDIEQYELLCLSPRFDKLERMEYHEEVPYYIFILSRMDLDKVN